MKVSFALGSRTTNTGFWSVAVLSLWFCAASSASTTASSSAGAPIVVSLGSGSELWLEGKSTMHDFESRTAEVAIKLARDPAAAEPADPAGLERLIRASGVTGVDVSVRVRSLRSGKAGLDKNLWRYMDAEHHPNVRCRISKYTLASSSAQGDTMPVHAEAVLEIKGRERPVMLEARAYRGERGLWLEGNEPLMMSDYGIRPPTMMLGALKVADRIVVHYRLQLVPAAGATGSSADQSR